MVLSTTNSAGLTALGNIDLTLYSDKYGEYANVRDKYSLAKVIILPVRWEGEPVVYMDIIIPVRAVYFLLNYEADECNRDLCSYIMIDFVAWTSGSITDAKDVYPAPVEGSLGVVKWDWTFRFDLEAL